MVKAVCLIKLLIFYLIVFFNLSSDSLKSYAYCHFSRKNNIKKEFQNLILGNFVIILCNFFLTIWSIFQIMLAVADKGFWPRLCPFVRRNINKGIFVPKKSLSKRQNHKSATVHLAALKCELTKLP